MKKKLPLIITIVLLVIACVLGLVANNGKKAITQEYELMAEFAEAQITELDTNLQAAEEAKTAAEAQVAELTAAAEEAKAASEAQIAELTAAADEAKAAAEAQVAELTAAADEAKAAAEAQVAELTAAVTAAEEAKAAAEEAKAAAEAQVAELTAAAAAVVAEPVETTDALAGKLVVLHTNDIHGRAVSSDDVLGYARIAALKKNLLAQGADVLLVDAGDFSQGTPVVNIGYGKNAVEFLNATGYDVVTLGNHEFDWGADNMEQNMANAEFDVLCANLTRAADGTTVFPANKIYETAIGKVGVFGLATPEIMTKTHPDKIKNIALPQAEALYAVAQAQVDELTAAECDLIVCLAHLGDADESITNRSIDVLANVTGIDLFIDGHSHTTIDGGVVEGETLRVSTGEYSEAIGYVVVEPVTEDEVTTLQLTAGLYTLEDNAEAAFALGTGLEIDEEVAAVVNEINAAVEAELSATFAKTEVLLDGNRAPGVRTQETNLGDFAADAILWSAKQALGEDAVDAALTNGGGIRASIEAGDVTMLTMKTVFPFGNEVATLTLTGAELLEALEAATWCIPEAIGAFPQVAGIEFVIDTTVPFENGKMYDNSTYYAPANPGARVTITSVAGQPWSAEAEYVIATNDFTAAGGDTYGVFAYPFKQTGYKTGVALEDALVNYTQTVLGGVIGEQYAEPAGRIIIK